MRHQTFWLLAMLGLSLGVQVNTASACGSWRLSDTDQSREVTFYAATVKARERGQPRQTVLTIRGDEPASFTALRGAWSRGATPIMTLQDGKISLLGQEAASLAGDRLRIGESEVEIVIAFDRAEAGKRPSPAKHPYAVTVKRGKQTLAHGMAMSFFEACGDHPEVTAQNRCEPKILARVLADIRNRVAFYWVWRESKTSGDESKPTPRTTAKP